MRALFTVKLLIAAQAQAYDFIDTTSSSGSEGGTCATCRAALAVANPHLTGNVMTKVAQTFLTEMGLSRPDLMANTFLTSMQGLLLTPDYFCSRVIKVCTEPQFETISL